MGSPGGGVGGSGGAAACSSGAMMTRTCFPSTFPSLAWPVESCLAMAVTVAWSGPCTVSRFGPLIVTVLAPSDWIPTTLLCLGVPGVAARLGVAWDNHEEERSRDACGEVAGMGEGWIGCNLGRIEVLLSGGTLGFL